ncbi:IclR family transcriptional regulator domain-containing protein [Halomontanus rarus]|uniref:IclR family transcriptional regulator domain-containing protein n=1 Tax=Halomontanus rarus TaxID=3034020 RepID=UPI001A985E16
MNEAPTSERAARTIKATRVSLTILEELKTRDGATLSELATDLSPSKSTLHCHLGTLLDEGYVIKENGEYVLSLKSLDLGGYACERKNGYKSGQENVDKLARQTHQPVQFVVAENGWASYLYQKAERVHEVPTRVGFTTHLHCTAAGKAILANLSEETVRKIVAERGLPAYTDRTITTRDELFDELESIRSDDIAFDVSERWDGIQCVAKPVRTADGEILGSISISAQREMVTEEQFKETYPAKLANSASVISINASYESIYPD